MLVVNVLLNLHLDPGTSGDRDWLHGIAFGERHGAVPGGYAACIRNPSLRTRNLILSSLGTRIRVLYT